MLPISRGAISFLLMISITLDHNINLHELKHFKATMMMERSDSSFVYNCNDVKLPKIARTEPAVIDELQSRDDHEADYDDDCEHDDVSECERDDATYNSTGGCDKPVTMNHDLIRQRAYGILLSTSNSMNINRFTSSFEEEGLFGLSIGIAQALASRMIQVVTGLPDVKHYFGDANQIVVLQFADTISGVILQALGLER
jgi:hypothetical protein